MKKVLLVMLCLCCISGFAQASSMRDEGVRKAPNVYCVIDSMDELPEKRLELENKVIKVKIVAYRHLAQLSEDSFEAYVYTKDRDKRIMAIFSFRGKERIKDLDERYGDEGRLNSQTVYAIVSYDDGDPELDILGNKCLKDFRDDANYSWK